MRTTVTLDPDTDHLIRGQVRKSGRSFKQTLNDVIRRGIRPAEKDRLVVEPLFEKAFPDELEHVSFNRMADGLDDEETLRELNLLPFSGLEMGQPAHKRGVATFGFSALESFNT